MPLVARRATRTRLAVTCFVLGLVILASGWSFSVAYPHAGLGSWHLALVFGVPFVFFGTSFLWYTFFPLDLVLDNECICLMRRGRLLGQIPLERIERVGVHHTVWRPDLGILTDNALVGNLFSLMVEEEHVDRQVGGVLFRLKRGDESETFWPGYKPRQTQVVRIFGQWSEHAPILVHSLRQILEEYRKRRGEPTPVEEDSPDNPFSIT